MATDTATHPDVPAFVIPTDKPLRFTAGKLIMISPKHKNSLGSVLCKMFEIAPGQDITTIKTSRQVGFLDFDTEKKYPIKSLPFSYNVGPAVIGKPILLVEDPFLVAARGITNHFPYNRKSEPFWVVKVLYEDKLCLFVSSKRTWKHYLAVIKPERAEKYGL